MGLFDRFKKAKQEEIEKPEPPDADTIGSILYGNSDIDIEGTKNIIRKNFGSEALINTDCSHPSVIMLIVRINGVEFWCSFMPFAMPADELDIIQAAKYNNLSDDERQAICAHRSFMIVAQKGGGKTLTDKAKVCRTFSRLCGALMSDESAVGFCLNSTGFLIGKGEYLSHTAILNGHAGQNEDYFPSPLWIWVFHSQQDGNLTIETSGLKQFGFLELQFYHPKEEPSKIVSRLYILSILQITGKDFYKNMDTIAFTQDNLSIFKRSGDKLSVIGS